MCEYGMVDEDQYLEVINERDRLVDLLRKTLPYVEETPADYKLADEIRKALKEIDP